MSKKLLVVLGIAALMVLYLSCSKMLPDVPKDDEDLDGPLEGLTSEQKRISW